MPRILSGGPVAKAPRVAVLGSFELRSGDRLQRLPKKAQGLLAFLAVHEGQAVSRDQLATLLWGNTATEQARQSLRQALVAVRGALGPVAGELIVADMDTVLYKPGSTRPGSDIAEFLMSCRSHDASDLERAAALWRGELLAGLHIPVEPFNYWVSVERQRLGAMRSEVLVRLADARASAGDLRGAIVAARDLTAHDPLREEGHRLLMRLLARTGQRSAALKQYERLTNLMSDQLGVSPDADTAALAAEIREGSPANALIKPQAISPPTSLPLPQPVMLAASADVARERAEGPALPDKPSIVVLPFTNLSGDGGHDIFIDGLVDDITIALGREKWLFPASVPPMLPFLRNALS
jgi:DNA-binding SARP family transcriptional activator